MSKLRILLAALVVLFARPAQAQNDPNLAKYVVKAGGFFTSPFQPKSYANGSEPSNPRTGDTIYSTTDTSLRVYTGAAWASLAMGGGSSAFSAITSGTNTGQTLLVGSGSSLSATGNGSILATGAASLFTLGTASATTGQVRLYNSGSAFYTVIQPGVNVTASRTYTLPTDYGAAGTVLTDAAGNGTLSWATGSSVSLSGTNTWTAANTFAPTTQGVAPVVITQPVGTSGTPGVALTVTGGAHTGLSNALAMDGNLNSARTVTFSGGGGAFTQYAYNFAAPTYTSAAAQTLTSVATLRISGAPTTSAAGGATPTITNYGSGTAGAFGDALHVVSGRVLIGAAYSNVNTISDTLTALVVNGPGAYGIGHFTGINGGRIEMFKAGDTTQTYIFGGAGNMLMFAGDTIHQTGSYGTVFGPDNSPTHARAIIEVLPTGNSMNMLPLMRLNHISPSWGGAGFTASTEVPAVHFDFSTNPINWQTGALTTQRFFYVTQPTVTFSAASTATDIATVAIGGAPIASTNATFTRSMALWVQAGLSRFGGHVGSTQTTKPTTTLTSTTLNDGAGSGASITVANGSTDTVGQITITAGNGVPTAGIVGQIVFNGAYTTAPKACMLQAMTSGGGARLIYVPSGTITTAQFQLYNDVAFVSATAHSYMYMCWE